MDVMQGWVAGILLMLSWPLLSGCGEFGLPAYLPDGTPSLEPVGDILDIDPKFVRVGESGVELNIYGINTVFEADAQVVFPDEPEIDLLEVDVRTNAHLIVTLDVGKAATLGVTSLQVITHGDYIMVYRDGFSILE